MTGSALIFDLDGTLVDTLEDLAETGNTILREFGFPTHPVDAYRYFVGNGALALIENILPAQGKHRAADGLKRFQTLYMNNWQQHAAPFTGVVELVETLVRRQFPLAVLSNKPHDFTTLFVDHFFPQQPFRLVYGHREGGPRKPDPTMALRILEELGCDAAASWFIGDTSVDMQTGTAAKMKTVGVTWGFRDRRELVESGADSVIDSPSQLLELL